jgi:serine/threonine protein phosphatase 1
MIQRWLARLLSLSSGVKAAPPEAPPGRVIYGIGDIHGEDALLLDLLARLRDDAAGRDAQPVAVFLGDYVDRGPGSRMVLDILADPPLPGFAVDLLKGNHEQAMLDFLADPLAGAIWLEYGGLATLSSYGVDLPPGATGPARLLEMRDQLNRRLPQGHRQLLTALRPWVTHGDYLFVHAGIRPEVPLAAQREPDLLWIREPFLDWPDRHEKMVVHGHTVRPTPQLLANRIGIDTGAYATGILTAVALEGPDMRIIQARRGR